MMRPKNLVGLLFSFLLAGANAYCTETESLQGEVVVSAGTAIQIARLFLNGRGQIGPEVGAEVNWPQQGKELEKMGSIRGSESLGLKSEKYYWYVMFTYAGVGNQKIRSACVVDAETGEIAFPRDVQPQEQICRPGVSNGLCPKTENRN